MDSSPPAERRWNFQGALRTLSSLSRHSRRINSTALRTCRPSLASSHRRPVEVVVTGILPSGGAVLTRTYHSALPDGAAATFAFYDEELGAWHAVPSTLSADRTSLSATVHHLSLWTDIVSGSWASLKNASEWAFDQIGKIVDVRVDAPRLRERRPLVAGLG